MEDMKKAKFGGHIEIKAMASMLGIRIHNLNVKAIGNGSNPHASHMYFGATKDPEITLLFRPEIHYDLALKSH